MKLKHTTAIVLASAVLSAANATQYSCLSIITATKQMGKWEALKAWIEAAGLKDEWDKCSYVSDAYPQYAAVTNALVTGGVFTDDEIARVLSASVDTAIPDESLRRVYESDMSNQAGRIRWHGAVVTNRIDTNALTRTHVYADGWAYVERFRSVQAMPVEQRLSAAERRARRESAAREREEAKAREKAERTAALQTNMTALASALAEQKQYPIDLATMLLQHELNTLTGTNSVDAVVTPCK